MMKVLVVSTMYPNSQLYLSGVFVHKQVLALKKKGVELIVVAPIPWAPPFLMKVKNRWLLLSKVPNYEEIDGISVYHPRYIAFPGGKLKQYWGYICAFNILRFFKKKKIDLTYYDLIHAHGALPDDFTGYLLSTSLMKPYILTVHGASVQETIKKKTHFEKSKLAIQNADAVIGVSPKIIKRIKEFTSRKNYLYQIYSGVQIENNYLRKNNIPKDKIIIMFGGNLVSTKGCDILLMAYKNILRKHQNLFLNIAGGGVLQKALELLALKLQVDKNLKFWGFVKHDKMLQLMSECDIFVLPSWDEALGIVYLEAMSLRKPVIGTSGEGISDIIINGENGLLVKAKDVDDLTEKLELLISDKNLREELGKRGFQTVRNLTWENNAIKTLEVYKSVLQRRL